MEKLIIGLIVGFIFCGSALLGGIISEQRVRFSWGYALAGIVAVAIMLWLFPSYILGPIAILGWLVLFFGGLQAGTLLAPLLKKAHESNAGRYTYLYMLQVELEKHRKGEEVYVWTDFPKRTLTQLESYLPGDILLVQVDLNRYQVYSTGTFMHCASRKS